MHSFKTPRSVFPMCQVLGLSASKAARNVRPDSQDSCAVYRKHWVPGGYKAVMRKEFPGEVEAFEELSQEERV